MREIEAHAREDGEDLAEWTPEMIRQVKTFKPRRTRFNLIVTYWKG